jgi:hypothetical protein
MPSRGRGENVRELGEVPSALNVAKHYRSNLSYSLWIIRIKIKEDDRRLGIMCRALDILMPNRTQRKRQAREFDLLRKICIAIIMSLWAIVPVKSISEEIRLAGCFQTRNGCIKSRLLTKRFCV